MYETSRLILRPWQDKDIAPFAQMGQDHQVMEYFPKLLNKDESIAMIERMKARFNQYGFCFYACELKQDQSFIGFIGLNVPAFSAPFTPCVEIGWRIASQYWGNGYATEGALKCLEIGFNQFKLKEIVSIAVKDNLKSIHVMEKIGMQRDHSGDFLHPLLPESNRPAPHILYRMQEKHFSSKK